MQENSRKRDGEKTNYISKAVWYVARLSQVHSCVVLLRFLSFFQKTFIVHDMEHLRVKADICILSDVQ